MRHTKRYLFDRDGRLPSFLLVQDRQTDSTGRIDIRMEERRSEFACANSESRKEVLRTRGERTFGWFGWIICSENMPVSAPQDRDNVEGRRTFREDHAKFIHTALPGSLDISSRVSIGYSVYER